MPRVTVSPENVDYLGIRPRSADALRPRSWTALARIKRVRLPVDTWMVDDQDEVDELKFEFEDEFEDYESLRDRVRRGPILGVLLGTTLFAGAVWVVLNSINQIRQANLIRQASVYPDIFSSESENELWVWMQAASGIAYAVFLVALGSYVVLWLALREESS